MTGNRALLWAAALAVFVSLTLLIALQWTELDEYRIRTIAASAFAIIGLIGVGIQRMLESHND